MLPSPKGVGTSGHAFHDDAHRLARRLLQFKELVDNGKLPVDMMGDVPLCMEQVRAVR